MKLNEFVKEAKKISKTDNPEIRVVTNYGFQKILEILPRSSYYDESFFKTSFEKGDFICIELDNEI
jgi:hypothetical protein